MKHRTKGIGRKMMAKKKPRAKRALPASFKQRSTKSGGGKEMKKPKEKGGVKGIRPGDKCKKAICGKQ